MNERRKFTNKDCGLFICVDGLRGYYRKGTLCKLVDVQQNGTLLVVKDQKGVEAHCPPLCFRQHFVKLSVWYAKNGMRLEVVGDAREYEDTNMRLLSADGTVIAEWIQNWTEFDDSGEKMHYGEYAPWTQMFLGDIIDAGCEDIPDDVDLWEFKHHRFKNDEWYECSEELLKTAYENGY